MKQKERRRRIRVFVQYCKDDRQAVATIIKLMPQEGYSYYLSEHSGSKYNLNNEIIDILNMCNKYLLFTSHASLKCSGMKNEYNLINEIRIAGKMDTTVVDLDKCAVDGTLINLPFINANEVFINITQSIVSKLSADCEQAS
jgi:hypothetical protein